MATPAALDNSHLPPEVQTDKAATKTVPCQVCQRPLIVNTFYAPAKARCSEHKGKKAISAGIRRAIFEDTVKREDATPVEPNQSLRDLRCPFDNTAMILVRVDDRMGFLTFKCKKCYSAVELMPNWGALVMPKIPDDLREIAERLNNRARAEIAAIALDKLEEEKPIPAAEVEEDGDVDQW